MAQIFFLLKKFFVCSHFGRLAGGPNKTGPERLVKAKPLGSCFQRLAAGRRDKRARGCIGRTVLRPVVRTFHQEKKCSLEKIYPLKVELYR